MTKEDFLYALQNSLSDLPPEDVDQSLEYYMEMIDDCMEDGMTEEEAVAQLGSLSEIAERIRLDMPLPTLVRARTGSRPLKAWEIVLLVLGSPVWLPILLSVFVILLSVYIVVWAVLISLYIVAFSLIIAFLGTLGLSIWTLYQKDILHGTFLLGGSLVCAALSILLFLSAKGLSKAVCIGTSAAIRGFKKRIVGKGSAS